jgi:energy-coupling factor transport system permease protein
MSAPADLYVPGRSWLYRLDPRVKLWFALLGIVLCVITSRLDMLFGMLIASQAILLLGGLPPRELGLVWRSLIPVVAIILIWQPILTPGSGTALLQIGPVRLTESGLLLGVRYALRIAAAAFTALVPVLTTPTNRLVRGLQKAGLPYTWGMAIGLALHYLGTVGELYTTITEAQQARGWDLSRGNVFKRARAAVPTLIALIIASLRLSDALAVGLAARGFGLKRQRTWWHDIALSRTDWLALILITAAFIGTLAALYLH